MLRIREVGGSHKFRPKLFCLTVPKQFVEKSFCAMFQKVPNSEKVYGYNERSIKIFRRKSLSHNQKMFIEELFCAVFQRISDSEKFLDKGCGRKYQKCPS